MITVLEGIAILIREIASERIWDDVYVLVYDMMLDDSEYQGPIQNFLMWALAYPAMTTILVIACLLCKFLNLFLPKIKEQNNGL